MTDGSDGLLMCVKVFTWYDISNKPDKEGKNVSPCSGNILDGFISMGGQQATSEPLPPPHAYEGFVLQHVITFEMFDIGCSVVLC